MTTSPTDRIEKKILLRAPRSRVWRALSDGAEFGRWFGVHLEGAFTPGARMRGQITHKGYEHLTWEVTVERVEPERALSFRWHPFAVDPSRDYSSEPTTLVTFELSEAPGGTLLTVVESGFDGIPLERRAQAFSSNDEGWSIQLGNIERHVGQAA